MGILLVGDEGGKYMRWSKMSTNEKTRNERLVIIYYRAMFLVRMNYFV